MDVLAHAVPLADMTYANSDRGLALCSRRSSEVSRLYLQVPADEDAANWSDTRFWNELHVRMFDEDHAEIQEGEIVQRDIARLRASVASPMSYNQLFLAGDAAHVIPAAGAKSLNTAIADVRVLARALNAFYRCGSRSMLDAYSAECLQGV